MRSGIDRLRRASRRSPQYIGRRLIELGAQRMQRPWSKLLPRLVTPDSIVRAAGARSIDGLWAAEQRVPFFLDPARRDQWRRAYEVLFPSGPAAIVAAAERVLRHEFDLLGSGSVSLGWPLPWHADFKTGREWPLEYAACLPYGEPDRSSDVKVPWELSRSQHFTALGQAYWLTYDERYAQEFANQVTDWIARNPWAHGVNWICAMDVALRAVSWIWGFYYMAGARACASTAFRGEFLRALYLHGEYIAAHIERSDVNGNHYLCDAVGLVFVGGFFGSTPKGRRWLQTGRDMIEAEIFAQTSDDGVDFEKSTAYHRLVLEAFVTSGTLLSLHGVPLSPRWQARLERMCEFVEAYVKPDGRIPLVGDADDGRIQKLGTQALNDHRYLLSTGAVLFRRADFKRAAGQFWDDSFWMFGPDGAAVFDAVPAPSTPPQSAAFPDGGFYVLRSERAHVFVDCGEVGMHGRGGHGHNDILGFELWLDGVNLVTDCGAYLYTASREWRNRFRSTAFHNVLEVDGEELNRFISPDHLWQLRDDARPADTAWRTGDRVDVFRGVHTGYRRLHPPVTVQRQFELHKDSLQLVIRDLVEGAETHDLVWRFHLDPAVSADLAGSDVCLSTGNRDAWLQIAMPCDGLTLALEPGWVSPSYGVRTPNSVVVLRGRPVLPLTTSFRIGFERLSAEQLQAAVSCGDRNDATIPVPSTCVNC